MVSGRFALVPTCSYETVMVMETGAGLNCVSSKSLPDGLQLFLSKKISKNFRVANGKFIKTEVFVPMWIRFGQYIVRDEFLVCDDLPVAVILGSQFIDGDAKNISKEMLTLKDMTTVPVIRDPSTLGAIAPTGTLVPLAGTEVDRRADNRVRLANAAELLPGNQTVVACQARMEGPVVVEPKRNLYVRLGVSLYNEVQIIEYHKPFPLYMANFSTKGGKLPAGTVVSRVLLDPTTILHIRDSQLAPHRSTSTDKVAPSIQNGQPEYPTEVENLDLSSVDDNHHDRIRSRLTKHAQLWCEELSEISHLTHRIELILGDRPISQMPYRQAPAGREFEKKEVHRMLKAGVIQPSSSEWASPIVLVPKKDAMLVSMWTTGG